MPTVNVVDDNKTTLTNRDLVEDHSLRFAELSANERNLFDMVLFGSVKRIKFLTIFMSLFPYCAAQFSCVRKIALEDLCRLRAM
jgi:hypothetical protein